jgi:uncharacterized Tic20 family protein
MAASLGFSRMARAKPTAASGHASAPAYAGISGSERGLAAATHALGVLTAFLGPLVLYLALRGRASPWLREHLHGSLNHWILATAAAAVLTTLAIVLGTSGAVIFVALLAVLVVLAAALLGAVSAVKAARGRPSHYPLNVRMVK